MTGFVDRLTRVAEWYESGPGYPRDLEEGRQRIASDIRAALAALVRTPSPSGARAMLARVRAIVDKMCDETREAEKEANRKSRESGNSDGAWFHHGAHTAAGCMSEALEELEVEIESALRSQRRGEGDVEQAARAMYLVGEDWDTKASFDSLPEYAQDRWRDLARAALATISEGM